MNGTQNAQRSCKLAAPARLVLCYFPLTLCCTENINDTSCKSTPASSAVYCLDMASSALIGSSQLSLQHNSLHSISHSQSVCGDGVYLLKSGVFLPPRRTSLRAVPRMGNINEGKGIFAPLVVLVRNVVGKKRFNQLRGKAIALHSQVITEFCRSIGADAKQRQGLIRLAKKNGEKLGFLA